MGSNLFQKVVFVVSKGKLEMNKQIYKRSNICKIWADDFSPED